MVKKKMKTKIEQVINDKKTSNYDQICDKIKKILSATAQTFIPELCDALRKDWFFEYTEEEIKANKDDSRELIRRKVIVDWSKDDGNEYQAWTSGTIKCFYPDWLRDPTKQTDTYRENLIKANQKKIAKKVAIAEEQKRALERYVNKLPDTVIIPEPAPEQIPELRIPDEPEGSDEPLDSATIREISVHQSDTELTAAEQTILKAMKNKEHLRHLFHEIASGSNSSLARLSINSHLEKLSNIRSLVDIALTILQTIKTE